MKFVQGLQGQENLVRVSGEFELSKFESAE